MGDWEDGVRRREQPAVIDARDAALQVLSESLPERHISPAEREQIARAIAEAIEAYMNEGHRAW